MQHIGIILAAGSGSRISSIIKLPKCLIKVNHKSILDYQIESFLHAGVKEVIIVTGFKSKKILNQIKKFHSKIKIRIIFNKKYKVTNNMYSAYLALKKVKNSSVVLCNGDVVVEKEMVKRLLENNFENLIMVDRNRIDEEAMKVRIQNNYIIDIDKKLKNSTSNITSTDFYKLSNRSTILLRDQIRNYLRMIGKKDWTEVALKKIFKKINFLTCDINEINWYEIDNHKDLISANFLFKRLKNVIFKKYKTFIIDIDGTTFKKSTPLNGTAKFIQKLRKEKKSLFFLSNNSSMNYEGFKKLFNKVKYNLNKSSMIISTNILIKYLKKNKVQNVYLVGNKKFKNELKKNKINYNSKNPRFVVVGYDDQLNYQKLQIACEFINKGVGLIATHDDNFYPGLKGPIPDAGSILSLIHKTTNVLPLKIFGKPSREIKNIYNFKGKTLVIGDRISKDIKFAKNCGYDSVLVLSGAESLKNLTSFKVTKPNYIVSSINDLF